MTIRSFSFPGWIYVLRSASHSVHLDRNTATRVHAFLPHLTRKWPAHGNERPFPGFDR